MRTLVMTLALMVGLSAMAQDSDNAKKTTAERAQKRTTEMTTELGLNADQQAKVSEINMQYADGAQTVSQMTEKDAQKKRLDVLKSNRDSSYKAVLTEAQYNKWMALRAEKKTKKDADKQAKSDE
ncbi:MAG: hypothetical protein ABI373_06645 [Flavobacteriales bacterium]